jgi:cap1 methyltransferase
VETVKETSIEYVEEPDLGDSSDLILTKNLISNINEKTWSVARKELNPYESPVPGYKTTVSRAYYKLWEIIISHPWLISPENNGDTLHICDAPGGFTGCVSDYFDKLRVSDTFHFATSLIHPEDTLVPSFKKQIVDNKKVVIIKEEDCDINNPRIATKIIKKIKQSSNKGISFITADGGIPDKGEYNSKEETHIELFFSEIFISLECLGENGCLVMKIFDIYTKETLSIINLLYLFFDQVCICKPETSRPTNSEKYVVCKGFKKQKYLESGVKNMVARVFYSSDKLEKIGKMFIGYHSEITQNLKKTNGEFRVSQIKSITETLDYIKEKASNPFSNQKVSSTKERQNAWSKKYNFYNKF